MIAVPAKIQFEVPHVSKKHLAHADWKTVVIALLDRDITKYYSWFLYKRFGLDLVQPLRGGHITFVSDRTEEISNFAETKEKWHNKIVDIALDLNVRTNGNHWWLKVTCPEFDVIRTELGLTEPFMSYHMTIGYCSNANKEQSMYAYQVLLND